MYYPKFDKTSYGVILASTDLLLTRTEQQRKRPPLQRFSLQSYSWGDTWVDFCWVCAAGLSEPLPRCSLFCGQ